MRKLRHIPSGGALVEVTTRTLPGRFLLRPSQKFFQIAIGVLARTLQHALKYRLAQPLHRIPLATEEGLCLVDFE